MLLGTYENQDEVQIELRNGVHKYQPIILAAGSIASEYCKSMKLRRYCMRLMSHIVVKPIHTKSHDERDFTRPDLWAVSFDSCVTVRSDFFAEAEQCLIDAVPDATPNSGEPK
jgi:hypothetical protein